MASSPFFVLDNTVVHGPKPYFSLGDTDVYGPKPFVLGKTVAHGPKPYFLLGRTVGHGPKPYFFLGEAVAHGPQTIFFTRQSCRPWPPSLFFEWPQTLVLNKQKMSSMSPNPNLQCRRHDDSCAVSQSLTRTMKTTVSKNVGLHFMKYTHQVAPPRHRSRSGLDAAWPGVSFLGLHVFQCFHNLRIDMRPLLNEIAVIAALIAFCFHLAISAIVHEVLYHIDNK
jgi:hypothetical protein